VVAAEAVAQTDEYTPPLVGQLKAEAQVLREQLSKLAGGHCMNVTSKSLCATAASATVLRAWQPNACIMPLDCARVVIWAPTLLQSVAGTHARTCYNTCN
jgi:hypothetical protein